MFKTKIILIEIRVSFDIPDWFPQDRLDKTEFHHYFDKQHAYLTHYNSAEDLLWKQFPEMKELCNSSWIELEYEGNPEQLPEWIELKKKKLNSFFNRYKEAKE
jgi:hypothetical protein